MYFLPDELYYKIFLYLDIHDLVLNCKLCNKRWYHIINQIKFKELIISNTSISTNYWFETFKPINLKNLTFCIRLDFLDYPSFRSNFSNLRYFKINLIEYAFFYEKINEFKMLEILELDHNLYLNDDINLNLPSLRIVKLLNNSNSKITIDSKKLEVIYCSNLKSLEISKPKTVRFIQVENNRNDNLDQFINLEVFKRKISYQDKNILPNLSNLRMIHFYSPYKFVLNFHKEFIKSILEQKTELKMRSVKIYFNGLELVEEKSIDDYGFDDKDDLYLFYKDYELLENNLPWFNDINYTSLLNTFNRKLPQNFFQKFNNIQSLKFQNLDRVIDQDEFLNFLRNCSNLSLLYLENASFNQLFYDQLQDCCSLLKLLSLYDMNRLELDFRFILKFKLMTTFKTNYDLPIELALNSLSGQLKLIAHFGFIIGSSEVWIRRINRCFSFDLQNRKYIWSGLDLKELECLCKDIEEHNGRSKLYSNKKRKTVKL